LSLYVFCTFYLRYKCKQLQTSRAPIVAVLLATILAIAQDFSHVQ